MFHSEFFIRINFFLSFLIIFNWKFRIDSSILNRKFYRIFFSRDLLFIVYSFLLLFGRSEDYKKRNENRKNEKNWDPFEMIDG